MIRKIEGDKKGDLRDNALELIIAVIGILLVIYAVYLIYNVFVNSENENAKKVLNNVEAKINALPLSQTGTFLVQGFKGADQWFLAGWSKGTSLDRQPAKCFDSSCICICKRTSLLNPQGLIDMCQSSTGFCRKFSSDLIYLQSLYSYYSGSASPNAPTLPTGQISTEQVNYIFLASSVIEVSVEKEKDSITLVQSSK